MKKLFVILGIALIILVIVMLVAGLTQPKDLALERSIEIKAPQKVVFNQIKYFKNWPNWSPWFAKEPNIKILYLGADGQVGSSYHWNGDEMGEGEMSNISVSETTLDYNLNFIKPWEGKADGTFITKDLGNGSTKVTWKMINHGTFPLNALNYFMEKVIGKDFEDGLKLLKTYTETHPSIALSANDIIEKDFPAISYATIRKKISFAELESFSTETFSKLASACQNNITSSASTIYYDWDEKNQMADMAPAFAVSKPIPGVEMVNIPTSKSCQIAHTGGYAGISKAHEVMGQYIAQRGINLSYVIEEYKVGPANEADSNKWLTNVVYILK